MILKPDNTRKQEIDKLSFINIDINLLNKIQNISKSNPVIYMSL